MRVLVRSLVVSMVLLVGSGAGLSVLAGGDTTIDVDVHNFFFDPDSVTIDAHDTIRWVWVSGFHSVETLDGNDEWCPAQGSGTCTRVFDTAGTYDYRCGLHPTTMVAEIIVVGIDPVVTITHPAPGASVSGLVTVTGTATHPDGITGVDVWLDAHPPTAATITGGTWSVDLDTTLYGNGGHTVHAEATGGDGETATTSITITIANPATIDLAVTSYTTTPGGLGGPTLTAVLENGGNVAVSNVAVRFEYHYLGTWREITTEPIEMAAFGSATIQFPWSDPGKFGDFDTRVLIDPDDEFAETEEGNNAADAIATFWLTGINGIDLLEPV